MKIFSWVNRKFHNNVLKEGSNYDEAKKDGLSRKSTVTKALLKQIALVDMHDGWKDGILSIGTFGFEDLAEPFKQESDNFTVTSEEQEDHYQKEQYFSNEDDLSDDIDSVNQEDQLDQLVIHKSEYVPKQDMQGKQHDAIRASDASSTKGDAKGERVTLAELFMADSDMKMTMDDNELFKQDVSKKTSLTNNHSKSSFVKKLILGGRQDSLMKFHKHVKKMLKKKIHPELGERGENKIVQVKSSVPKQLLNEEEIEVSESISFLLT